MALLSVAAGAFFQLAVVLVEPAVRNRLRGHARSLLVVAVAVAVAVAAHTAQQVAVGEVVPAAELAAAWAAAPLVAGGAVAQLAAPLVAVGAAAPLVAALATNRRRRRPAAGFVAVVAAGSVAAAVAAAAQDVLAVAVVRMLRPGFRTAVELVPAAVAAGKSVAATARSPSLRPSPPR
ncbi:MAG: hypothetical protein KBG15_15050 [Kofleriaceae bacterium]|nr:hypothetical protein [Kofleriaceae bacterium]